MIVQKVYRMFMYTVYIRIFIEIYMFTVLMIVSEMKYYFSNGGNDDFGHNTKGKSEQVKGNSVSLGISFAMLALPILFLLLTFMSWKRNKVKMKIDENCKSREFYNGILQVPRSSTYLFKEDEDKDSELEPSVERKIKIARFYSFLFLIRRLKIAFIAVLIPNSLFAVKASLFLVTQSLYVLYTILSKSFAEK